MLIVFICLSVSATGLISVDPWQARVGPDRQDSNGCVHLPSG